MSRKISKNLVYLRKSCLDQRYEDDKIVDGKRGVLLEGSSRSTKTIASVDFIILLCSKYERNCTINILKETFAEFKTTLYDDFKLRLSDFGLDNPFMYQKEVKSFKILGNKINFIGCDKINKTHGASSDYLWLNEPLPISNDIFDQYEMRCRKFWWLDFNPSVTDHWIFNKLLRRPDVGHLRTTFKDNHFISVQEKNKILGYEPWKPNSYHIEGQNIIHKAKPISKTNQPPVHKENIEYGTADEFMWRVYGLGLRGVMRGLIFKQVTYIDEFPDIAFTFGLDFGFVADPTALVRYAQEGTNIYLELLTYTPIDNSEDLSAVLSSVGVSKATPITADSADTHLKSGKDAVKMVRELFELGWEVSKVSKTKGIIYWLGKMKKYKIHIVKNDLSHKAKKEQENYKYKEVHGIKVNQPIDAFNHFWDAARYAHMSHDVNNFETTWN